MKHLPKTPVGVLLVGLWLVAILAVGYGGNDDKYITYFVADRIAQGHGTENVNGQYLEQSSTFLFTYILAATAALTGQFTAEIGYFVSVGFYLLCLLPMSMIMARFGLRRFGPGIATGIVLVDLRYGE